MTIQEAIKSGKPFRRPEHEYWLVVFQNHFVVYVDPDVKNNETHNST